ncbi:cytochrome c oxidase assembly protein [Kordiimonas aestuarii]|uniref:cytochrome c oxidase assembly protein n=1 Tax=Kordiimonas aestuarii TaxID=1005925 RepID=UPI0021CFAFC4|nr:cytochrome c oxidase assembly protein [Kordiimonas aestuarii]
MSDTSKKNSRMALVFAGVAFGMVGMAYAAVPLYNLFCKVTGYGGTTQQVDVGSDIVLKREMKVRFNASVHRDMPWDFKPVQISQKMHVGEQKLAHFEAYNPTNKTIVGTATYNVTPHKAGEYFAKIECFCFTEQELKPGERIDMPVVYFIDPLIDEDPNLDEVSEVTLSYTFFVKEVEDEKVESSVGR